VTASEPKAPLRALVVDDEVQIATAVVEALGASGISADTSFCGFDALSRLKSGAYDFVILDMGLPDMDGTEVMQQIRCLGMDLPIVVLTARGAVADRVGGLQQGADDYVTKPFFMEELVARVEAVLRRRGGTPAARLSRGCLRLDVEARVLFVGAKKLRLTEREFELMGLLMRAPAHVFTQDEILEHIWDYAPSAPNNIVPVYVSRLRSKIADAGVPDAIHTIRGVGYRMAPEFAN